jgi:ribokinase
MAVSSQVVVVGSIMRDLTFKCRNFPAPGETIIGRLETGQGGKGSNQAIACGKVGVRTTFVGAMGDEPYVDEVESLYRALRIGSHLVRKPRSTTGTAAIILNAQGQNQIVIEPGANATLAPRDIPAGLVEGAQVLIVQSESSQRTTAAVLRRARRAGVITVLNPAPMRHDFDHALLEQVDILVPNESEFAGLIRGMSALRQPKFDENSLQTMSDAELQALCRRIGIPTVIVTLGARGAFVSQRDGGARVPAHRGLKIVDTTGAGDAFCGGFAAGLVRCRGHVIEAVRLGTAVAALSITKLGAAHAMPSRAEIARLVGKKQARAWGL